MSGIIPDQVEVADANGVAEFSPPPGAVGYFARPVSIGGGGEGLRAGAFPFRVEIDGARAFVESVPVTRRLSGTIDRKFRILGAPKGGAYAVSFFTSIHDGALAPAAAAPGGAVVHSSEFTLRDLAAGCTGTVNLGAKQITHSGAARNNFFVIGSNGSAWSADDVSKVPTGGYPEYGSGIAPIDVADAREVVVECAANLGNWVSGSGPQIYLVTAAGPLARDSTVAQDSSAFQLTNGGSGCIFHFGGGQGGGWSLAGGSKGFPYLPRFLRIMVDFLPTPTVADLDTWWLRFNVRKVG